MCLLCPAAIGRPTSCRQTVLVYLVTCYPKRKSDSRVRSWEIWTIFLDDFFFPIPIFFCGGIWLRVIPMLGSRILQGLFLGWSLLSSESQDSPSGFGHELYVALVWKLRGMCACRCVCLCVCTCWPYGRIIRFPFPGISGFLERPSFSSNGLFSLNKCLISIFC